MLRLVAPRLRPVTRLVVRRSAPGGAGASSSSSSRSLRSVAVRSFAVTSRNKPAAAVFHRRAPVVTARPAMVWLPKRWLGGGGHGGHGAAAAAPAAHGHGEHAAAAEAGHHDEHHDDHGPVWDDATQHERLESYAIDAREHNEAAKAMLLCNQPEELDSKSDGREFTAEDLKKLQGFAESIKQPEDAPVIMEECPDGIERPHFVPATTTRAATYRIIYIDGERIQVPEIHYSLDFLMSSPADFHTFDEPPAIKEAHVDESGEDNHKDE